MGLNIRLFSVVLAAVFGLWLGGCASSEVETASKQIPRLPPQEVQEDIVAQAPAADENLPVLGRHSDGGIYHQWISHRGGS